MTQLARQKVRRKSCSGPKLLFMSALATAILVLPIFLNKTRKAPEDNGEDRRKDIRNYIFMIAGMKGRTTEEQQVLNNIYAWIDMKSPGKTMSPDTSLGFKNFTGKPPKFGFTASDATFASQSTEGVQRTSSPQVKPIILGEAKTVLTKTINDIVPWKPFWEVSMPEIGNSAKPEGIIWRGEDGRQIANAPVIDEKNARESWNKHAPTGVTTLECSQFMGRMPPRVIVRSTCGNSELDLMAAAALRRHLLSLPALTMIDKASFRPFRTDVLWHLRN